MDMMLSWQIEKNDVKAQEKERLSPCQQSGKKQGRALFLLFPQTDSQKSD